MPKLNIFNHWNRGPSNTRQYLWNFSAVCLNAPRMIGIGLSF